MADRGGPRVCSPPKPLRVNFQHPVSSVFFIAGQGGARDYILARKIQKTTSVCRACRSVVVMFSDFGRPDIFRFAPLLPPPVDPPQAEKPTVLAPAVAHHYANACVPSRKEPIFHFPIPVLLADLLSPLSPAVAAHPPPPYPQPPGFTLM